VWRRRPALSVGEAAARETKLHESGGGGSKKAEKSGVKQYQHQQK
jgi:hypothetical protein